MSRKVRVFLGLLLIFTLIVVAGCGGQQAVSNNDSGKNDAASQKTINLSLAHFWPATHMVETEIVQGWIKAVEQATGGRVKITSYPAGTLVPSQEIYDGVTKGVADIGLSAYSYNRGRFPVVETFLLPGIEYNNSAAATEALTEGIQKLNPKELQDTHYLFSIAVGPGDLMTTKKPVRTLEDMKGLQLGATAGLRADAVQLLGAAPVVLPMPEWYEALSKGMIGGGVAPLEVMQGFRVGEVTGNYITLTPFLYNQLFYAVMNKDKWNSLPPDIQKAITDTTKKFYEEKVPALWDQINKSGLQWTKQKKNVEIITLSAEEKARWLEKIKPLETQYVKTLNEKGLPGEEILKTVKELAQKYNAKYPEVAPYIK